jgi:hypothetical protein
MKHDKCHRTRNATTTTTTTTTAAAAVVVVVGWMKTETPGVVSTTKLKWLEFLI